MASKAWWIEFPQMERESLVALRKALDGAYREFSRSYGELIETFFEPLLNLQLEELVRLHQQRLFKVVDRETVVHGVPERLPVAPCRPELEDMIAVLANDKFVIRHQSGQAPRSLAEKWGGGIILAAI